MSGEGAFRRASGCGNALPLLPCLERAVAMDVFLSGYRRVSKAVAPLPVPLTDTTYGAGHHARSAAALSLPVRHDVQCFHQTLAVGNGCMSNGMISVIEPTRHGPVVPAQFTREKCESRMYTVEDGVSPDRELEQRAAVTSYSSSSTPTVGLQ
jgi:hypothetical protein